MCWHYSDRNNFSSCLLSGAKICPALPRAHWLTKLSEEKKVGIEFRRNANSSQDYLLPK